MVSAWYWIRFTSNYLYCFVHLYGARLNSPATLFNALPKRGLCNEWKYSKPMLEGQMLYICRLRKAVEVCDKTVAPWKVWTEWIDICCSWLASCWSEWMFISEHAYVKIQPCHTLSTFFWKLCKIHSQCRSVGWKGCSGYKATSQYSQF